MPGCGLPSTAYSTAMEMEMERKNVSEWYIIRNASDGKRKDGGRKAIMCLLVGRKNKTNSKSALSVSQCSQ
jgi:hypothetical protein